MKIMPMDAAAVPYVAELEKICFPDPWSAESIHHELENPWAIWLVAVENGQFAGYLGIEYGPDGADIMNIAIVPAFRRCGIAKKLLHEMCTILREKRLQWLTLEVRASNASAIALYRGFGFSDVGLRKKYYRHPVEDAILMTLFFDKEEVVSC